MTERSEPGASPDSNAAFRLAAYEQCFAEKHHYDNLSWTIGAVLLVFVGAILAYIPQIKPALATNEVLGVRELLRSFPSSLWSSPYLSMLVPRVGLAAFACLLLGLWHTIYEPNRIWAEIANQEIRDLERSFRSEGIGIRFAKENANIRVHGKIELENADEHGKPITGYSSSPASEVARARSMHDAIPSFLKLVVTLLAFASPLP